MKRRKEPPTKLDEIVADVLQQDAAELEPMSPELERLVDELKPLLHDELEPMSPELEPMVEAELERLANDELEPMSPELACLIEQSADTTDMPRACHAPRQKRKRKRR